MKKYLLLATTAMLFAGNAMAGTVAGDGQSAEMNIKAIITQKITITNVDDMNFGKVVLGDLDGDGGYTKLVTLGTDGTLTPEGTSQVIGTGNAGVVTVTPTDTYNDVQFDFSCGEDLANSCQLMTASGSELRVINFNVLRGDGAAAGKYSIGADLYARNTGNYYGSYDPSDSSWGHYTGSVTVSIKY